MADGYNNGNWVKVGGGTEFFNFFNLVLDDNTHSGGAGKRLHSIIKMS